MSTTSLVSSPPKNVLVVGAGYAGLLAAFRARRVLGAEVTVLSGGTAPSSDAGASSAARAEAFVERVRVHEHLASGRDVTTPLDALLGGIAQRSGHAVQVRGRAVVLADGRELPFDHLIVAAGSVGAPPGVPGGERCLPVALSSRSRVAAALAGGERLVVVGAGSTGVELAAELAEVAGPGRVALVGDGVLPALDVGPGRRAVAHVRAHLERAGVAVHHGRVEAVAADHVVVRGAEGTTQVAAELCLWSGGFKASPLAAQLAALTGAPVDSLGRVAVLPDLTLPGRPDIQVVGDCAWVPGVDALPGCKSAMPLAAHAIDALAARAGGRSRGFRYADPGVCVSLGRRDGVVVMLDGGGRPIASIRGRLAAAIKERICRYVVWSLGAERDRRWAYRWRLGREVMV